MRYSSLVFAFVGCGIVQLWAPVFPQESLPAPEILLQPHSATYSMASDKCLEAGNGGAHFTAKVAQLCPTQNPLGRGTASAVFAGGISDRCSDAALMDSNAKSGSDPGDKTNALPSQNGLRSRGPSEVVQAINESVAPAPVMEPIVLPANSGSRTGAAPPSLAYSAFRGVTKLLERNFSMPGYTPPPSVPIPRRAPPAPLDPVFPSTEFIGTNSQAPMGVNDNNHAQYPLEQYLWKHYPALAKQRIRLYGWLNPGMNFGTSHHSNFPMSYIVASNSVHWDQVVLRAERVPDTVQQEHMDWGFRLTSLYGEDYRFTTAKGWFSNQLLKYNHLTGWDPCEAFGVFYVPKFMGHKLFDGVSFRIGRYISCPDIEAQLAPDNYLFTHSLMFTVDTYTQTGIQSWIQLNKYWNIMFGFHGGADTAPWTNSTVPTGQCLIRWVSKNNKDSFYGGINDINGAKFRNSNHPSQGKDNLQQANINWTHVFNRRCHTVTEWYALWTWDAFKGGTVSNGPVRSFGGGGGPGALIPGNSQAYGFVNYTLFKITDKDYICVRPVDILDDPNGWRTGYKTWYSSGTVGWCHRFSDLLCIRPEIRWEAAHGHATPYDNGTKRSQVTFAADLIQRF